MCRSIKPLRMTDRKATEQEINEAALQYIRKVSGYRKPSRGNQEAFDTAVLEVAQATEKLLNHLQKNKSALIIKIPALSGRFFSLISLIALPATLRIYQALLF